MAYEQKDNTGSLFKNDKKETENHPDYTGTAKVAGTDYYLSGWINETKAGKKYLSVKIKPREWKDQARDAPITAASEDMSDKNPF